MPRSNISSRGATSAVGGGLFRRTYEAMLGARERQARLYVNFQLLQLDDAALERLGYDRRTLQAQGSMSPPF